MTTVCKIKRKNSDGYKYPRLCELTAFLGITDSEILSESKRLFGEKTGYHDARFDTTAVYLAMNKCAKIMEKVDGFKEYLC